MRKLLFDSFWEDPEVKHAKAALIAKFKEYQSQLTGPKKGTVGRKATYKETLEAFGRHRGGNLWYPYLGSGMGNGALVELSDGSVKLDFISGIGAHFGHGHPDLIDSNLTAAFQDVVMQGNLQQNRGSAQLTQKFTQLSGLDHCFLTTSGVMAVENALKMILNKKSPANRILAFEKCFMGRTLAIAQVTDKAAYRPGLPDTLNVDYVPFYDAKNPKKSTQAALDRLNDHLSRYPGQYAVMCFELIQGEAGYYAGTAEFFKALMTVLKTHNIAILVDEIQTFGRNPGIFAFKQFGLGRYVDIVTVGKLSQVCATLYRAEYKPPPGLVSQTFTGSSSAIESANAILTYLARKDVSGPNGKIAELERHFHKRLQGLSKKYPKAVSGPFGKGLMVAFTPYDGAKDTAVKLVKMLYENGLIGFLAGNSTMRIRFLPPVGSVTKADIDLACDILEKTIKTFKPTKRRST